MTNLKLWRQLQSLSQGEAAAKLGLGLSIYQLLESGRLKASPEQRSRLRRLFGAEAETMLQEVRQDILAGGKATA